MWGSRRAAGWVTVYVLAGAILLAIGVIFLVGEGLERASWWAGLGAFVITVVSAAIAVTRTRQQTPTDADPTPPAEQDDPPRIDESPAPLPQTGTVEQHNTGGINIANTGTIGQVDVRADGGSTR
ncbi:hypothetical protein [Verrucosispora sp. ts21]|uniref:hypothetical protein n=1 Tax=Verrucosispora sp. ts21 TaxID=2069341 RepID=UPI001304DEB2|nr:hypothetical protein [Verrucosispora sp. ts21]